MRPSPAEKSVEDQTFFLIQKNLNGHGLMLIVLQVHTLSVSHRLQITRPLTGTQLQRPVVLFSCEYMFNQKELSDESKAVLIQIKLDVVATHQFSWLSVHNNMLMCHLIALEYLSRMVPPIDKDQKNDFLHAPLKGSTMFRIGQTARSEHSPHGVFPKPAVPSTSYSTRPHVGC